MLVPNDRRLLLDAMRPPDGYTFDRAIGTTFTLDLLSLLITPVAFTLFDCEDAEGRLRPDPMALLEAVRRHADRIFLFCHAGQISVPRKHQILYSYLEGSVIEVLPPRERGFFHPKLWLLRFVATADAEEGPAVWYRLLVLSRNHTFDRSWDTMLVLDGELTDRTKAIAANHPIANLVAALPALAVRQPVAGAAAAAVETMQRELRVVRWVAPEGVDECRFWPIGIPGHERSPFEDRMDRVLVVSPFLSAAMLEELAGEGRGHTLVSRLESLQEIPRDVLELFDEGVYFLNPAAHSDPEADVEGEPDPEESSEVDESGGAAAAGPRAALPAVRASRDQGFDVGLLGLHAKLFIADRGRKAAVFTGSANATTGAFSENVELLVELIGTRGRVGIDTFLEQPDRGTSFRGLLQRYEPTDEVVAAEDETLVARLEDARRRLAKMALEGHILHATESEACGLALRAADGASLVLPDAVRVEAWPVSLGRGTARTIDPTRDPLAELGPLPVDSLTAFVAFEASLEGVPAAPEPLRFVLNVRLVGVPADRAQRILRAALRDRAQVMRFLMFLLSGEGVAADPAALLPGAAGETAPAARSVLEPGQSLLEALLRALDREPARLDQVAHLVSDLRANPELAGLLPDGFAAVWDPIWAARQRIRT